MDFSKLARSLQLLTHNDKDTREQKQKQGDIRTIRAHPKTITRAQFLFEAY
jgi:hypothetical protein